MNAMCGGTASPLTIRTVLPSDRSASASPSSLPIASQSGRMWLVSTNDCDSLTSFVNGRQSMGIEAEAGVEAGE